MRHTDTSTEDRSPRRDVLAIHVMRAISRSQRKGRGLSLEDLAIEVGARKPDVRNVVSTLHAQGYVDAVRMRLTMAGLAIAAATEGAGLRDPRACAADTSDADRPRKSESHKLSRAA